MTTQRVQPGAVTEVNVANQPVAFEQLEVAIHRTQVKTQASGDVLGGHRPVSVEQRLQHQPARGGQPQPPLAERCHRISQIAAIQSGGIGGESHRTEILTHAGTAFRLNASLSSRSDRPLLEVRAPPFLDVPEVPNRHRDRPRRDEHPDDHEPEDVDVDVLKPVPERA